MRPIFVVIVFAMFSPTAPASAAEVTQKTFCSIPFEWCQLGCPELGPYSIAAFGSSGEEASFVASLAPLQQETVRRTTFAGYGKHIVIAYRVAAGSPSTTIVTVDICQQAIVTLRGFVAVETAAVEAARLPLAERASMAIFAVAPAPINDPNTRALLLVRKEAIDDKQDQ